MSRGWKGACRHWHRANSVLFCWSQTLRQFDIGAPWVSDVGDSQPGRVRAGADGRFGLNTRAFELFHEVVDVLHFESHVIGRPSLAWHLRHICLAEGNLGAGNAGCIELATFA